nr:hypothetical protein ISGA_12825 [Gordonia sp. NB41Y]
MSCDECVGCGDDLGNARAAQARDVTRRRMPAPKPRVDGPTGSPGAPTCPTGRFGAEPIGRAAPHRQTG